MCEQIDRAAPRLWHTPRFLAHNAKSLDSLKFLLTQRDFPCSWADIFTLLFRGDRTVKLDKYRAAISRK